MKNKEIKTMNESDINKRLIELRKENIKLRSSSTGGSSIEKPSKIKLNKKMIARILTLINKGGIKKLNE